MQLIVNYKAVLLHIWFQGKFGKRDERPVGAWSANSCLKLDVYTQTESSYVADNSTKSLVRNLTYHYDLF